MNACTRSGWSILLGAICLAAAAVVGLAAAAAGAQAADPPDTQTNLPKGDTMKAFMDKISIQDASITIQPGTYPTADGELEVKSAATFTIDRAELVDVTDEKLTLPDKKPESFLVGARLAGPTTYGINGAGSIQLGSLRISETPGGQAFADGQDYLVEPQYGMVGLAPGSRISTTQPVYASYQYSLLRLDSIVVDADGNARLLKGKPDVAIPRPPDAPEGSRRLLNIFRPYGARTLERDHIFPVLERPDQVVTRTTRGRIPKTIAKIKASRATRIVCLGDSVTAGGDSSVPELMYSEVFRRAIMRKYSPPSPNGVPLVSINVLNESYGGTCSSQWLRLGPLKDYIDEHPEMIGNGQERITLSRVLEVKPDLVSIEFVNDVPFSREVLEELYGKMISDLQAIGAEVILITPHFCSMEMMSFKSLREPDSRAYVEFLHEFAERHNLAVADASARWAHLWKEGIPYTTLLANTLNHPDDRGHQFFAEELMNCFE